MSVHVYAPNPVRAEAIVDFDCPGPAPDRRRCGSYHAVAKFYEWHGWTVTCCFCGSSFSNGERHGGRVRGPKLAMLRATHASLREPTP
jgi:hypothetical protein